MPTFQPFQNGINSVRTELNAAMRGSVGVPIERKTFLRANEHAGILPPKAKRPEPTDAPLRQAPFGGANGRHGGQTACEAAQPFEASTAPNAALGLPEPSAPTARYCPPSSRFSLLEGIGAYVRRTLPFNRVNEGVSPSGGGVISGALDDPGANGLVARIAYNDTVARTIGMDPASTPAATVADGDGVAGNPTISVDATLIALAGLNSTAGLVAQTGADAFTKRSLTPEPGEGVGIANGDGQAAAPSFKVDRANTDSATVAGADEILIYDADDAKLKRAAASGLLSAIGGQPLDADLTALAALTGGGMLTRNATFNTYALRSIVLSGAGFGTGSNLDGQSGNPTLDLSSLLQSLAGLSIAQGALIYGVNATSVAALAKNASATRYLSNTGASNDPAWAQVNLTNGVTGTLPVGNGGTGGTTSTGTGAVVLQTSPTLTTPNIGVATGTSLAATGLIKSSSASAGVGYATGAGSSVTQITSKSTAVTINAMCGQITMHNAALGAGANISFVVNNSSVAATDTIILNIQSVFTLGNYLVRVDAVAAGSFTIGVLNRSGGSLSQAGVLNFAVIKAVTS